MSSVRDELSLLRASRRLDWRFLLPDPRLGVVGHAAATPTNARDALELFAGRLVPLDPGSFPDDLPTCDLVVLEGISPARWTPLLDHLRSGGWVYAELPRAALPGRGLQLRRAERELTRAGFTDVEAHWHWPGFDTCEEIAALHDDTSLRLMLMRRRAYGHATKALLARLLVWAGLMADVASDVSVIGRRP